MTASLLSYSPCGVRRDRCTSGSRKSWRSVAARRWRSWVRWSSWPPPPSLRWWHPRSRTHMRWCARVCTFWGSDPSTAWVGSSRGSSCANNGKGALSTPQRPFPFSHPVSTSLRRRVLLLRFTGPPVPITAR
eukprot:568302-Pyramimonas_sp.AAC.1